MMKAKEAKEYITQIREEYNYYQIESNVKRIYGRIVRILDQVLAILEHPELIEAAEAFATEALKLTRKVVFLCRPFSCKTSKMPFLPRPSLEAVHNFTVSFRPIEKRFVKIMNRATSHEQWYIGGLLDVVGDMVKFGFGGKRGILGQLLAILARRQEIGAAQTFAIEAFKLTREVVDLWDSLNLDMGQDCFSSSALHDFFVGFEPIENQIKDLIQRRTEIAPPPMKNRRPLVGLEEDVQLITSRLLAFNSAREVVSIVGSRGIGKTTLAQMVYDSVVVQNHFGCHAWVSVPQNLNIISVQLNIAIQVMPFEYLDKAEPVEELLAKFLMHRRYLIVLDDVQTAEDWTILEQSLPAGSSSSRIMITTRNREIVHDGLHCFVHEKRALSDDEGWELFNARVGSRIPTELEKIGRGIVMKCTGLPLFICEWADKLSRREASKEQWELAVGEINQDQELLDNDPEKAADDLDPNTKKCLFCFDHFLQDYEVPVRRVIAYWVAEGSFQGKIDTTEAPECIAEKLLMKLVQQNLIVVAKGSLMAKRKHVVYTIS